MIVFKLPRLTRAISASMSSALRRPGLNESTQRARTSGSCARSGQLPGVATARRVAAIQNRFLRIGQLLDREGVCPQRETVAEHAAAQQEYVKRSAPPACDLAGALAACAQVETT